MSSDGPENPWSFRHEPSKSTPLLIGVTIIVILLDELQLSSILSHKRFYVLNLLIEETYLVAALFVLDSFDVSDEVV